MVSIDNVSFIFSSLIAKVCAEVHITLQDVWLLTNFHIRAKKQFRFCKIERIIV